MASFLLVESPTEAAFLSSLFSSLSESGFIPTISRHQDSKFLLVAVLISFREWLHSYTRRFVGFRVDTGYVLISFREWLHSYICMKKETVKSTVLSSHLFQRVASFLQGAYLACKTAQDYGSHLFQRVASFLQNSKCP